jgi:hypothetical protein
MRDFFKFLFGFFHGWRRKCGLVTLLLASLFLTLWIRSLSTADDLCYSSDPNNIELIAVSEGGRLLWWGHRKMAAMRPLQAIGKWSLSLHSNEYISFDDWDVEWTFRRCGLEIGVVHFDPVDTAPFWVIPYWLTTLPLMGLAAFLLLIKPRQSTSKKTTEPIPEKVA